MYGMYGFEKPKKTSTASTNWEFYDYDKPPHVNRRGENMYRTTNAKRIFRLSTDDIKKITGYRERRRTTLTLYYESDLQALHDEIYNKKETTSKTPSKVSQTSENLSSTKKRQKASESDVVDLTVDVDPQESKVGPDNNKVIKQDDSKPEKDVATVDEEKKLLKKQKHIQSPQKSVVKRQRKEL